MRNAVKWGVMLGAWVAMITSLGIESPWAKEIWSSIATIGFMATLWFYIADR